MVQFFELVVEGSNLLRSDMMDIERMNRMLLRTLQVCGDPLASLRCDRADVVSAIDGRFDG